MKKIFCFIFGLFLVSGIFANTTSSSAANRKTALRYLQLAKNYVAQNDWAAVKKSCENGIQYDENIADLYYLNALSLFNLSYPRYKIIPVIKKSLSSTEWVDYNMTNARVFYADMLCSTGKPLEAIEVLDKAPLIYSSDAEYVRIKALYEINSESSVAKAEEKVESARRVYPKDVRFFYLFFNYEYNRYYRLSDDKLSYEKNELTPLARKIADSFIAHIPDYDKSYSDLEILASTFAEGESQRRLLKAFNARGFNHILYPLAALEAEIISEEEALDYFLTFIDGKIEKKLLIQFYSMIKDESLKKYFDEHLNSFCGTLVYDTNNTLEENLSVKYERGRPSIVSYDNNNDENLEWQVECDFGVPQVIYVFDEGAKVLYADYPNVKSILFEDVEPQIKGTTTFEIIDGAFVSKPFDIEKATEVVTTDFYVVDENSLIYGKDLFVADQIAKASNIMDKPSIERDNGHIRFSVLNGIPYEAQYFSGNKKYAHSYFRDEDICIVRVVDMDDDGIFETTEYYKDDSSVVCSNEERIAVTTNIWGSPVMDSNLYLAGTAIDRNADTEIDFKESYYSNGSVVSEWDSDFDGIFDVRFKKIYFDDGAINEEYGYLVNDVVKGKYWANVTLKNGVPVLVSENGNSYSVIKGQSEKVYWLNNNGSVEQETEIIQNASYYDQGQVFQLENNKQFFRVVRIGENIFINILDKENSTEETLSGEN